MHTHLHALRYECTWTCAFLCGKKHVHVCACSPYKMYLGIHVCTYVCTYTGICMCVYTWIDAQICVYLCIDVCVCVCVCLTVRAYMIECIRAYIYIYIYIYAYVYIHTHLHVLRYECTRTCAFLCGKKHVHVSACSHACLRTTFTRTARHSYKYALIHTLMCTCVHVHDVHADIHTCAHKHTCTRSRMHRHMHTLIPTLVWMHTHT
jgi:hypothetical protein